MMGSQRSVEDFHTDQIKTGRAWTLAEAPSQLFCILRSAAKEGLQQIAGNRLFVVVPAETRYVHEQP